MNVESGRKHLTEAHHRQSKNQGFIKKLFGTMYITVTIYIVFLSWSSYIGNFMIIIEKIIYDIDWLFPISYQCLTDDQRVDFNIGFGCWHWVPSPYYELFPFLNRIKNTYLQQSFLNFFLKLSIIVVASFHKLPNLIFKRLFRIIERMGFLKCILWIANFSVCLW